jgi:dienelactone hydrolase
MADHAATRRDFLGTLGAGSLAAIVAAAQQSSASGDEAAAEDCPAPPDQPRELKPSEANLGSLFLQVQSLAESGDYPYSFIGSKFKSLAEFHEQGRAKVFECFGYRPPPVAPKAEIIARDDCGDFIREKLLFSTSPELRVPAYLHIPKAAKKPAPAIVDLHSHGGMFLFGKEKVIDFGEGKNHAVMTGYHERNYGGRPTTTELVRRGYVVITIDAFMFGERRLIMDDDQKHGWDRAKYTQEIAEHLNGRCRSKEATLARSLIYAGLTWPGIITWDDIRTVDYLVTRPEVDAKRIGCVGVSLGGWRTIFLAALDERIKAACITGFMSTVRPMIRRHIDTHSFAHFVPGLHQWLDLPDVASLTAPRPLLVQQCRQDALFPPEGMEASVEKIAAAYEKADAADRFTSQFYDGGHRFDVAMQDAAFKWFQEQLSR